MLVKMHLTTGLRKVVSDSQFRSIASRRSLPQDLTGKVVLITGASSGIGASCAWQFAEEGCHLVLVGRRDDKLQALKMALLGSYPKTDVHTVVMSVSDLQQVAELPKKLPSKFRNVDILLSNAGLAIGFTSVDHNDVYAAQTVLDTNVLGTIALCSAFLPGMKERGFGHLINMGSIAVSIEHKSVFVTEAILSISHCLFPHLPNLQGRLASSNNSTYNASKFAVHGFTEAARHDLAGTPIRVTHIAPGMVGNTEFSNLRLGDEKAAAVYENIVPLHPDDVADTVIYAVSLLCAQLVCFRCV